MKHSSTKSTKHHRPGEGTYGSYTLGFVLSIIATLIPYFIVQEHVVAGTQLLIVIVAFALIQLFVQLVLFLHLGFHKGAITNLVVLIYAVVIIVVVVAGSLWIMKNLNDNMMDNVFPNNDYSPQSQAY